MRDRTAGHATLPGTLRRKGGVAAKGVKAVALIGEFSARRRRRQGGQPVPAPGRPLAAAGQSQPLCRLEQHIDGAAQHFGTCLKGLKGWLSFWVYVEVPGFEALLAKLA